MIWHLYTLKNVHHNKYSYHLSPCKVMTIKLTIFPMFYLSSPWHLFYNGYLYPMIPFTYFTYSPHIPSLWQPPDHTLHLWVCSWNFVCFCLFFFRFQDKFRMISLIYEALPNSYISFSKPNMSGIQKSNLSNTYTIH